MSTIQPRTARVAIYQGDDLTRLAELDDAVTRAEITQQRAERAAKQPGPPATLDETDSPQAIAIQANIAYDDAKTERDTFAAEAEARGVIVALKQIGRKEWRRLRNAHPPRDGNTEDAQLDCNVDSLPDEAIPLSIDHSGSTIDGSVEEFLDSLSSYDYYNRIFMTVLALNVGSAGADPKLRIGSDANRTSSSTSN